MLQKSDSRRHLPICILLLMVWTWAAIAPLSRQDWLLENLLVFAIAAVLLGTYPRFRFSTPSYWLFAVFLTLHLYGSHYTYSETPFGYWLQEVTGASRNHFDRIVHFAFGLLLVYPLRELLERLARPNGGWLELCALTWVMALSSLYEQIEMLTAMIVAPELGAAYLGTQGDPWDAQKDAGLAILGALIALAIIRLAKARRA